VIVGAAFVFSPRLIKLASRKFLAGSLGFSTGVMLYVSFVEIFQKGVQGFSDGGYDDGLATTFATVSFFGGVIFMFLCDLVVHKIEASSRKRSEVDVISLTPISSVDSPCCPVDGQGEKVDEWVRRAEVEIGQQNERVKDGGFCVGLTKRKGNGVGGSEGGQSDDAGSQNPKVGKTVDKAEVTTQGGKRNSFDAPHLNDSGAIDSVNDRALVRMGLATALSIAIHNFPEGLATFVATVDDPAVGATLAIAIAIHNIPEGLCVSIPIYYATGDRKKAFLWGLASGLTEPIGAALGWAILADAMSDVLYGCMFGIVSGMMVMICIKELLPTAHRYDPKDSVVTLSVVAGMFIMALSLVLFVSF